MAFGGGYFELNFQSNDLKLFSNTLLQGLFLPVILTLMFLFTL